MQPPLSGLNAAPRGHTALTLGCCGRGIAGQSSALSSYQLKMHFSGRVISSCAQHRVSGELSTWDNAGDLGVWVGCVQGHVLAATVGVPGRGGRDVADPGGGGSTA